MTFDSQSQLSIIVSTVLNSLSFLGCLLAFYMYFQLSVKKSSQFKMLFALTLADFLIAISGFLMTFLVQDDITCTISLALSIIGYWSASFWSLSLAIFSYKILIKMDDFDPDSFFKFSLYCWTLICLIIPLIPIFDVFGVRYTITNGGFCGISILTNQKELFWVSKGIFGVLNVFITLLSYIKQKRETKRLPAEIKNVMTITSSGILCFSIAQSLIFLPELICEIIYMISPYESSYWNVPFQHSYQLAGFVICLLYFFKRTQRVHFERNIFEAASTKLFIPYISSSDEDYLEA